jgi:hypothetical protein
MKKKVMALFSLVSFLAVSSIYAESSAPSTLTSEANFYQIDPVSYYFLNKERKKDFSFTTCIARLWYSFFPADSDAAAKPLFVLLNGGPGCGTSTNLFAMNTAPYTLHRTRIEKGKFYQKNAYSWTKMGNLLYIDAPNTGFSYDVIKTKYLPKVIDSFISGSNYNSFIDAAQVLRVVLRFLNEHPELQKNKVIFVGESYSGVRVSTMLNLLLFYTEYSDGTRVFKDIELAKIIKNHLDKALPEKKTHYKPKDVALQFERQILIQPQIAGKIQSDIQKAYYTGKNSPIGKLDKKGKVKKGKGWKDFLEKYSWDDALILYLRYIDKDQYNYSKNWTWSDDLEEFSSRSLLNVDMLSKITGCNITKIPYMQPKARKYATRYMLSSMNKFFESHTWKKILSKEVSEAKKTWLKLVPHRIINMQNKEKGSFEMVLGQLNNYDSYLVGTNVYVYLFFIYNNLTLYGEVDTFDICPETSSIYGKMFLENLSVVETFMTDTMFDLVIYSPTLPEQFQEYKNIVENVKIRRGNAEIDGSFTIYYKSNSLKNTETPDFKTVYWPHYAKSGHSVSSAQPKKFRKDIEDWINDKKKVN